MRPVSRSRAPVGSSPSRRRGAPASARAAATRCCSPPESSAGKRSRCSPRPTRSSSGVASAVAPWSSAISSTFSRAVRVGIRLKNWKMKPTVSRRKAVLPSSSRASTSRPATITSPRLGGSIPPITLSSVVFPEPLGPSRTTNSCGQISRSTSRRAWTATSPLPYVLATPRRRTSGAVRLRSAGSGHGCGRHLEAQPRRPGSSPPSGSRPRWPRGSSARGQEGRAGRWAGTRRRGEETSWR